MSRTVVGKNGKRKRLKMVTLLNMIVLEMLTVFLQA